MRSDYRPRYSAAPDGRLGIDSIISNGRRVVAIERDPEGTGDPDPTEQAGWDVETDEDGVTRMPLSAPCFFDPPEPEDIGSAADIADLDAMHGDVHPCPTIP